MDKLQYFAWSGLNYDMAKAQFDKINELIEWAKKHDRKISRKIEKED